MTHFSKSRLELQNGILGKDQKYQPRLYRSRTDVRLAAGNRSSPVKPNLGDEIFSIAHQWLINKTGSTEDDLKGHEQVIPTIEVEPPATPSREMKVYIPLEKTYRAELRQITERIGLKLNENESSRAARDFVTQNPAGTEDIISQEKKRTQRALEADTKKSITLPRAQTSYGAHSILNRRRSCFETSNRKLDFSRFGRPSDNSLTPGTDSDKLFLRVKTQDQASTVDSKSSRCRTEKSGLPSRTDKQYFRSNNTNDVKLVSSRNRDEVSRFENDENLTTKIKVENHCSTGRTLVRRKAQRRTPNATKTMPPVALEDSLKYLQVNDNISSFHASGIPDIPPNFTPEIPPTLATLASQRRQTAPHLDTTVIQNSASHNAKYLALPSYDLRYHLEPERPWIKNDVSESEDDGSPATPKVMTHNPPAESVSMSIRKCTEWLARCPSPAILTSQTSVKYP